MSKKSPTVKKIFNTWNDQPFEMAGTEGTGEYVVICATRRGRLGVRYLPVHGCYRIRVEPSPSEHKTSKAMLAKMCRRLKSVDGWKLPGHNGQDRFSIVTAASPADLVRLGMRVIGADRLVTIRSEEPHPEWTQDILDGVVTAKVA